MQDLTEFKFDCRHPVRVLNRDGEAWFVLTDVCAALNIANHRNVTARLDDDEKGVHIADTLGGEQTVTVVSEAGLYSLILTSRKREAKPFKRWVTHEVLPTLRRTGTYQIGGITDPRRAVAFLHDQQLRILHAVAGMAGPDGWTPVCALAAATGLSNQKIHRTLSLFEVLGLLGRSDTDRVRLLAPVTGEVRP